MSLLDVKGLTVRFGGLTAVESVDLRVNPGEIFSVIGPNGAGKTTVFNAVTGVYEPAGGAIRIDGKRPMLPFALRTLAGISLVSVLTGAGVVLAINLEAMWDATINANFVYQQPFPWRAAAHAFFTYLKDSEWRWTLLPCGIGACLGAAGALAVWTRARRTPDVAAAMGVARTFQNPRLFHQMTVLENILVGMDTKLHTRFWHAAFRLPLFHREKRSATEAAMEILRFVELDHESDSPASSLSYGHQRRLEIGRALASKPKLLLLDEPAAGMNPSESAALMVLIRKIRDRGVAVMLIEHHMNVVMGVSDRIAVLDYGHKIAEGTPDEIRADPNVRKAYLGAADV